MAERFLEQLEIKQVELREARNRREELDDESAEKLGEWLATRIALKEQDREIESIEEQINNIQRDINSLGGS